MKLIITNHEARTIISDKFHGIYANDIEIQPVSELAAVNAPIYPMANLSPNQIGDHLSKLIAAASTKMSGGYVNKIEMIKQVRALTGYGLKESKDLVESALIPF